MPKGNVRCSKCHAAMSNAVCGCGHSVCYVSLYWKGKQHRFFRYYLDGELFNYERAVRQLGKMNFSMEEKTFNPVDWTTQAVKERLFVTQAQKWLDIKKDEVEGGELSPETLKNYRGYTENYYLPFFKEWDVREIRFEQLEAFKDSLRGKVKGLKTRRNILNALHAMFNWFRRKGIIPEVPTWPVIEGDNAKVRLVIDYETQAEALKRIPAEHRDPIEFGFETGLRPGEITALQVGDIDVVGGQALIQRTWSGAHLRETTKGRNKKWIPLSERAHEIVLRNLADKLPGSFLFINPETGRRYTAKKLNQVWRQYSKIDLDYYSASRHSFCTQIVQTGVNVLQAQALLRHADIRSTQRYFHAQIDNLRDVVNRRGKVVPIERALNEGKARKRQ